MGIMAIQKDATQGWVIEGSGSLERWTRIPLNRSRLKWNVNTRRKW